MRIPFLRQKPDIEAEVFAEAQALVDDGLDVDFVLGLYPEDAEWLRESLEYTDVIGANYAADEPSYYFEASLKGRFLEAARQQREGVRAAPAPARPALAAYRTAMASSLVVAAAAAFGVVSFGFATSDDAVPGDWNYAFKRAGERVEYSLSRGDNRIDVQLSHAEARIYEIQRLTNRGDLAPSHVARLVSELDDLRDLAGDSAFNDVQRARVNGLAESTVALLGDPDDGTVDDPVASEAITRANEVVAAASGSPIASLPTPTATPTATATPTETATETATPSPTETPSPTAEPTASATPSPTEVETATASATATAEPEDPEEQNQEAEPEATEAP